MRRPVRSRFLPSRRVLAFLACAAVAPLASAAERPAEDPSPSVPLAQEKVRGRTFAAKAAREKGAVKTGSGLVFVPVRKGRGESAATATTVWVSHLSKTIDGKVFDHASNVEINLESVIPCWQDGIRMMKVGGKAKLVCPPELAFGDRGDAAAFPAGATLVYEIELRKIVK